MIGIKIEIDQGQFQRLTAKLASFERQQVVHQTVHDTAVFMQGKMREYPPQISVTRAQAYGQTFQNDKQRRWFFAALRRGELTIPYKRTGHLADMWRVWEPAKNQAVLTNDTSYAGLVQERGKQSRMMTIIGWRTVSYWLQRYSSEIGRVALSNIRRWIES